MNARIIRNRKRIVWRQDHMPKCYSQPVGMSVSCECSLRKMRVPPLLSREEEVDMAKRIDLHE
jgi:sigma-70-like protein